jgi:hypothetical protein
MSANGVFLSTYDYDFIGGGNVVIAANTYVITSYNLNSLGEVITTDQPDGGFSGTLDYNLSSSGVILIKGQSAVSVDVTLNSILQAITVDTPDGVVNQTIPFSISSTGKVYLTGIGENTLEFNLDFRAEMPLFGSANVSLPGPTLSSTGGLKPVIGEASLLLDFFAGGSAEVKPIIFGTSLQNSINYEFQSTAAVLNRAIIKDYELSFNLDAILVQATFGTATGSYGFTFNSRGINLSTHSYDLLGKNDVIFKEDYINGVVIMNEFNSVNIRDEGKTLVEIV